MNIIALIPTIIDIIKALEQLMPESAGKQKLDILIATIETTVGEVIENKPALEKLVSAIVSILKVVGVFKSRSAA